MSELSRAELMADPRPRLPVKVVAEIWGCSPEKVVWLVNTKRVEAFSLSSKPSGIRIFPLEVERKSWLAKLEIAPAAVETFTPEDLAHRMLFAIEHVRREPDGFVYFIQCDRFVKIGSSIHPRTRKKDLQGSTPHRLRIIKVIAGSVTHEKTIHYALPGCLRLRRRNEWFHLTPELREAIKMLPDADRRAWGSSRKRARNA